MRNILIVAALIAANVLPLAASAQTELEGRVGRLESEMRAVQRKVFPGGAGALVTPENTPVQATPIVPGSPSSGAVSDLTQRVSAMEGQLASLTGQIETTTHRVQLLEDSLANYRRATDARLAALEGKAATIPGGTTDDPAPIAPVRPVPKAPGKPETAPASSKSATAAAKDPARGGKLAAIEKPSTGDAGEDAYLYGYRLWTAKLYPEAEAQLSTVVSTYPKHKRASYARNLLGRAYFDEGSASGDRATLKKAANTFLENYQKVPDGDRAPESLYYLGQSLTKLDANDGACRAYDEALKSYADKLSPEMKTRIAAGRVAAKCK